MYIFTTIILTLAWSILSESFSLVTVLTGGVVSICSVLFAGYFLPLYKAKGISMLKLITYPIYLVVQIYISAFYNIKMVLSNTQAVITKMKTDIDNELIKVFLSHSITLTPGTVTLDLSEDEITVLSLENKRNAAKSGAINTVNKLEKRLHKAQKSIKER